MAFDTLAMEFGGLPYGSAQDTMNQFTANNDAVCGANAPAHVSNAVNFNGAARVDANLSQKPTLPDVAPAKVGQDIAQSNNLRSIQMERNPVINAQEAGVGLQNMNSSILSGFCEQFDKFAVEFSQGVPGITPANKVEAPQENVAQTQSLENGFDANRGGVLDTSLTAEQTKHSDLAYNNFSPTGPMGGPC